MSEKHRIAKAAGVMSAATLISRVLGFARDMIFALYLGASGLSDAFFTAFRIPNLLRELFAEGSMASAVIPVLTEHHAMGQEEARRLVRAAIGFILAVVGTVCLLGIAFAPQIVAVIAPGFLGDPEKFSVTVYLTRIMFPFLLFISLASLLMGALNTRRVFFIPAVSPALLNVAIIGSVLAFALTGHSPVVGAAVGVTLGGFIEFAFQGPSFIRQGYSLRPSTEFRHPGMLRILALVMPITLGIAVAQVNIVVSNILASFLAEGSITYLFYSMRLIHFPIGVFGVAMGMAVLPSLSEHAARGDMAALREDFSFALRLLLFITVPSMAGLIALREPIVSTLFQRGAFDYTATQGTALALLYYSLGIWAMVGSRVTASAFYSMKDTKRPVKAAVAALLANIVLSIALMRPMGHAGLALANALSSMVNLSLLYWMLRGRLGSLEGRKLSGSMLKTALASAAMAAVAALVASGGPWAEQGMSAQKAMRLGLAIAAAIGVYIGISRALGSEELGYTLKLLGKRYGNREEE